MTHLTIHLNRQTCLNLTAEIDNAGSITGHKKTELPAADSQGKKLISQLETRQTFKVISTGLGSVMDFEALYRQTGHELMESKKKTGCISSC